jgi:hypothetical protein
MNATADYSHDAVNSRDEDVLHLIFLTFDVFISKNVVPLGKENNIKNRVFFFVDYYFRIRLTHNGTMTLFKLPSSIIVCRIKMKIINHFQGMILTIFLLLYSWRIIKKTFESTLFACG